MSTPSREIQLAARPHGEPKDSDWFIVTDHGARMPDLIAEVGPLVRDGRIAFRETAVEGLENAPAAFRGLLRGENTGKMVVKLSPG